MPVSRRRNENAAYTVSSPDIRRTSPADSLWQSTLLFMEYGVACAKEWNTIIPQRDRFVGHEWATPCILRKGSFNKAPKLVQHQVGEEEGCRVNNERSQRSYSVLFTSPDSCHVLIFFGICAFVPSLCLLFSACAACTMELQRDLKARSLCSDQQKMRPAYLILDFWTTTRWLGLLYGIWMILWMIVLGASWEVKLG